MTRKIYDKVMWAGRATVFLVGLSVILAVVFGVASTATAKNGDFFKLGTIRNVATLPTTLVGRIADATKAALVVRNTGGGPALALRNASGDAAVDSERDPMTVDTQGRVENLNSDMLDNRSSEEFADGVNGKATNASHADDSELLDGRDSTQFAGATHAHSGADITSGTVAEARVDSTVTRDGEVMNIVKSNDGEGSGLDADTMDGQNSTAFAGSGKSSYGISTTLTPCTDQGVLSRTFSPSRPALVYASGAGVYNQGDSNLTSGGLRLELRNTADDSMVAAGAYMSANANGNEVPLSVQGMLMSGNNHNSVWNSSTPFEVNPNNSYNLRLVAMSSNGSCAGSPRMGKIALSYLLIGK